MTRYLACLPAALLLAACGSDVELAPAPSVSKDAEYLLTADMQGRDVPFSSAVRVGELLFLSGMIGFDNETGTLVEGGIQAETRASLDAIARTLEEFGSSMEDVVKCTVFLADMSEWAAMNEVYTGYFVNKPARSALGVAGLALGARVEIECIAAAH